MKKYLYIFAAFAVALSCSKAENDFAPVSSEGDDVFQAYFQTPAEDTKISMYNDFHMFWNSYGGDEISVFSRDLHSKYVSTKVQYVNNNSNNYAVFTKVDGFDKPCVEGLKRNYALFPYSEENSIDANGTLHISLNGGFRFAARTRNTGDKVLLFKNLSGYVVIPVIGNGKISKVTLKGNADENLRGPATVVFKDSEPVVTMDEGGDKEAVYYASLEINPTTATNITISVPPTTFKNGFTVYVEDVRGNVTPYTTNVERTVERNTFYTMDPIEYSGAIYPQYNNVDEAKEALDLVYDYIGNPGLTLDSTPTDFGILSNLIANECEGSDFFIPNSSYNWYDTYLSLIINNPGYRNTYCRFYPSWNIIREATAVIAGLDNIQGDIADEIKGQAKALRAYAYMSLAPHMQVGPSYNPGAPCLPIIDEDNQTPYTTPSATVAEVYDFVTRDLVDAERLLGSYTRSSAASINLSVVFALRARTSLMTQDWANASFYASRAMEGYTPASISEVSAPSFMDISEHNWIWGCSLDADDIPLGYLNNTTSAWLRPFSVESYVGIFGYAAINKLLYDLIPATDVRKGWWLDENVSSPLLDKIEWDGHTGTAISFYECEGKIAYSPYTGVKFGCNPIGTRVNTEDMPLVRVEEMHLLMAEAEARLGNTGVAKSILSNFVKTYRDPQYNPDNSGRSLLDEIWFQRRVELWGEGFAVEDVMRLGKPLVRFSGSKDNNFPSAYSFNLEPNSPYLIWALPQRIKNAYVNFTDNRTLESIPAPGSGEGLLDGVTD